MDIDMSLLRMLERGFHHFPVTSADGRVLLFGSYRVTAENPDGLSQIFVPRYGPPSTANLAPTADAGPNRTLECQGGGQAVPGDPRPSRPAAVRPLDDRPWSRAMRRHGIDRRWNGGRQGRRDPGARPALLLQRSVLGRDEGQRIRRAFRCRSAGSRAGQLGLRLTAVRSVKSTVGRLRASNRVMRAARPLRLAIVGAHPSRGKVARSFLLRA